MKTYKITTELEFSENENAYIPKGLGNFLSWSIIENHGDGTVTVEVEHDPEQQISELQAIIDQLLIDALEVNNA